jgi:hypothetical protein
VYVTDGESEICEAAVWRWYVKQGKPWWTSRRRERPRVSFVDARRRLEAYQRAMKAER